MDEAATGADAYRRLNRANWDERVPIHVGSPDYDAARFDDPDFLSDVVRFDRPRLGDLHGVRGIHLQCHIGTDTVSLARLGAQMTGLDFSAPALAAGRSLAERAGVDVTFLQSDVDDAVAVAGAGAYDLVYTGIGALCWLPDVRRWAQVVAGLLAPGGRLFIREGHPVLWSLDDGRSDALVIGYPYFEQAEPMVFTEEQSYVASDDRLTSTTTHQWNHGLGEIVGAVLEAGLVLVGLEEHQSVPWDALPGRMEPVGEEFQLTEHRERVPLTYTLRATKPAAPGEAEGEQEPAAEDGHLDTEDPSLFRPRVYGDSAKLHVAPTAVVNDALFNLSSGEITVGEWTFFGHGVSVLTGTHDWRIFGKARQTAVPKSGRDVVIEEGVWVSSGATVVGPCRIGANAVVAVGAVVMGDVAPYTIVGGVPAKVIRTIPHDEPTP